MEPQKSLRSTTSSPAAVRLALKPNPDGRGFVDGAWWPRSTNPTTEFTALLTALIADGEHVTRLAHNLTSWEPAPRKLDVGRQVRLEGFHSLDRRTVTLTRRDGHRTVLLVVPPDTSARDGDALLTTAADRDNTDSPGELLARRRTPRTTGTTSGRQPTETSPEDSWETDGGHLLAASRG